MVTNTQLPSTREDIALAEVGHTDVRRGTVRFLLVFFLTAIAAVPAFELTSGGVAADGSPPSWSHLTRLPAEMSSQMASLGPAAGVWKRSLAANRAIVRGLIAFENAIEDESRLGRFLRPPAQLLMSGWLGAGNERAYVGRNGWLFYRPDVEYVTGDGFLDPARLERRVKSVDQWTTPPEPDPRKAIVAFKRQLEARGIALIVMPTPVKTAIHPEQMSSEYADARLPLENPSYAQLIADLTREGVVILDASSILAEMARASQVAQYLATDTHWRPEAMEGVAGRLAELVRSRVALPSRAAGYTLEPREVRHLGDIAVMLDLPQNQSLYAPEAVVIRRVILPDGSAWRPARDADVLVLGDSFSNIFSLPSMGWGDTAGFVEQLSYQLQRPVDRIVQNDEGSYATRALLRRAGEPRLAGKRVVIYQFAARELMFGDWKIID
jgi:hypothetical protein